MSLINKMLQDLDARGPQAGAPLQGEVKSVSRGEQRVSPAVAVGAIALAVLVGVGGVFGWRMWKRPAAPPPVALAQAAVVAPQPVPLPAPTAAPTQAAVVVAPSVATAMQVPASKAADTAAAHAAPAPAPARAKAAPARSAAAKSKAKHDERKKLASHKTATPPAVHRASSNALAASAPSAADGASAAGGRDMSNAQKAESEYRRAVNGLQEGRVAEAIAALEQALKLEPRHDAARQTLVGLLVEAKRPDEAIRLLQTGLTLEPRQPGMAMLLARLQIERGGNGIDTLMRTLPYVGGNGDYHAFLAGALQRQARHREAAEQYQAALQTAPQQGVWWMGLGISLQADKRNAEALSAFQRARASGTLNADLQTFVDRRLQQLTR